MGQEPAPQGGQEPPESKEGQEPQGNTTTPQPTGESKTFDEEYVKSLRAEAAKYRTEAQEAKAKVEEFETANASDLEKANKAREKAEQAAAEAQVRLLRFEVAAEKQVPAEAMDLLVGSTREELEAKADKLLEFVKAREKTPEFDGGAREPAPTPKTPEQAHNELLVGLFGGTQQSN